MTMLGLNIILAAVIGGSAAGTALAEETPAPIPAVVTHTVPTPRLATVFEVKLRLTPGQGLAQQLLDAGVGRADAAEAARLAAGHCAAIGGCSAKVAISRALNLSLRVERIVLFDATGQTVIERRNGQLGLNPAAVSATKAAVLI